MFVIAAKVGARFTLFTVIVRVLSLFNEPSLARTVAGAVPAFVNPGARWMFPVVGFVVVTVMYVGPSTLTNVSGSPSGSAPVSD